MNLPTPPDLPYKRLLDCSAYKRFNEYYQKEIIKLADANFCRIHKACSQCAQRRATKLAMQVMELVLKNLKPEHYLYLLTSTVRNGTDLIETNNRLFSYFRVLTNRYMRKNVSSSITKSWLGGIWNYEITHNGKTWHPHMHGLIISDSPITTKQFRKEWEQISGGDSFMCDATLIKHTNMEQLKKAVLEVCKYMVKNTALTPEQLAQFITETKGKQLLRRFGLLSAGNISLDPNLEDYKDEPFISHLFQYFTDGYKKISEEHYQNENDFYQKKNPNHKKCQD
jgi:hypothetical protein